ncbi:guanylate kinase [Wenyingzhuangia sp. IMCC45533]
MASGKLIVFSAPSGSGKTTIVRHLLSKTDLPLDFSISAASRSPREGEVHGKDYYFLSADEFKRKVDENAFLEWEEVYKDNFYGTLKSEITRIWKEGKHVIFDIDVVGGLNIKKQFPQETLAVFVQPPSIEEMERRLRGRATETEEKIKMRVAKAAQEIGYAEKFDTILINDNLEEAKENAYQLISNFIKQ